MTKQKNILKTIRANYFQPAFLICAGLLLITASTMSASTRIFGFIREKEPLPLKRPLSQLDNFDLAPYKVAAKQDIENPDILETLGTEDYIQWVLEDTSVPQTDKSRFCSLFITYYEFADNVPHRPEECYIGGGFEQISSEAVTLDIQTAPATTDKHQISAQYLVFAKTNPDMLTGEVSFPVLYIFRTNDEYSGGRNKARFALKIEYWKGAVKEVWLRILGRRIQSRNITNENLRDRFSYFSKVEWKFYGNNLGRMIYPDKQQALSASEKLLAVILPVLEKEHWPRPDNSGW
jgi:hypothetical protein